MDRLPEVKPLLKMNIKFQSSLCKANEHVLRECENLKIYGFLEEYYIRNGFIKFIRKKGDAPKKINHPNELAEYFKEYYDHDNLYDI